MKKCVIRGAFMALMTASLMMTAACDVETSGNGDLDGFWHLEQVDTLSTGGKKDLSGQTLFWGIQAKLIHLQGAEENIYLRFTQTRDSLIVSDPYLDHWHQDRDDGGDIHLYEIEPLAPYGIQHLREPFKIEALSGSKMILTSATLRLYFVKF